MAAIEFIYFDLGNVILDFSHELACQNMADTANVPVDVVRQLVFGTDLQRRYETGLISSRAFHHEFCSATGSNPGLEELLFASSDIFELNQGIVPIIAGLISAKFPIGILSNTCEAHWDYVLSRFTIVRDCFPITILSYQAQSMKPDPVIYQKAIDSAQVEPATIFFMDDQLENVHGAKTAGIDSVLFRSASELVIQLIDRGIRFNI